jgi:hypothetical protein
MFYIYEQDYFSQEYNKRTIEKYFITSIKAELNNHNGLFISETFPEKPKIKKREILK